MSSFTVSNPVEKKRIDLSGKPWTVWTVNFAGEGKQGSAEILRPSNAPAPDGNIDATYEETTYGPKLKEARKGGGGGGKSPQERAEIRRMWALSQSIALLTFELAAGAKFDPNQKASDLVGMRADWLDEQVRKAGNP